MRSLDDTQTTTAAPARMLPHDAERRLVGAMMLDPRSVLDARELVEPTDFSSAACRVVFDALCGLDDEQIPVDFVTVRQRLLDDGKLHASGGVAFLVELSREVTSAAMVKHHARIVADAAQLRCLHTVAAEIREEAGEVRVSEVGAVQEFVEDAEERVFEIGRRALVLADAVGLDTVMAELVTALEGPQSLGAMTGLTGLDDMLLGLHPGDFVVLGGRPGQGKTTVGLAIARELSRTTPTLFATLEMTSRQLCVRVVASETGIDGTRIRSGRLTLDEAGLIDEAASRMVGRRLMLCDSADMTVARLRALARRMSLRGGLGAIIVDYLQLMRHPGAKGQNRQEEVSNISRGLKLLAKEMGIPVVGLCQLSRETERDKGRPKLYHLRESGSLEQDADVVLLLYREDEAGAPLEVIVAKHRQGATGTVNLFYKPNTYTVGNWASWGDSIRSEANPAPGYVEELRTTE